MRDAIRAATLGTAAEGDVQLLRRLGFLTGRREPNSNGRRLYDAAWVYDETKAVAILHRDALLTLPATQALMQGLHGRGAVSVSGALHFLARHRMADVAAPGPLRGFLHVLNQANIVAYSKKHQTVRITAPLPEGGEEFAPVVRVVDPDRPYSNVRHLREVLRRCDGYIWWADPHFSRKGLEPLIDEADADRITEIRILSGQAQVNETAERDWRRFHAEMAGLGISAEWRVAQVRSDGTTASLSPAASHGMCRPSTPSTKATTARLPRRLRARRSSAGGKRVTRSRRESDGLHRAPDRNDLRAHFAPGETKRRVS